MWESFKILLLCLFSIFIASLTDSWIFICAVLLVLVVFLYDFDFSTGLERHAISKLKYSQLKVINLYTVIFQREQNISSFQYTPTMNSVNKQTSSFDLSRFNKSGNALSPISNSANSGTFSSRRLIQSRQTSTPLTRTSPWQKNSISPANNIRSPAFHNSITNRSPRYSLSSLTPKTVNNESPVKPTIQTVTGPLLASTRFNVNLGTYTDTKSPGLASRVVQYHNELSGNQTSTHQTKYGSPGQFPIVQLYKKELPILGRSARRCTVRIAPPDPVSYNSDHANTILRDSFVQSNDNANRQNDTEINTRSVLEALKEISRKRIHTNDDMDDMSKRQRKNSISSPANSSMHLNKDGKRMREDTPPKPKESSTTPVNSAPKRICVVNEIESSLSSSRLMRLQQGQKRKSSLNVPESNKQRRVSNGELISRETQTTITNGSKTTAPEKNNRDPQKTTSTAAQTESEIGSGMLDIQQILDSTRRKKKSTEIRSTRDIDEENSTLQFAKPSEVPIKSIFSEAPLEIMKQNKLSVMLSALAGSEPEIIPLPDMTLSALKKKSQDHPDGTDIINKEVVSILSPKNKPKHDKHVTFAIPNSDLSNDTSAISSKQVDTASTVNNGVAGSALSPVSASSITTDNVSSTGTNVAFGVNFSSPSFGTTLQANVSNPLTFSTVSSVGSNAAPTSSPRHNFMFGSVPPPNNNITLTTNSTNIITSSGVDISENSPNKNTISFGSPPPNFNFGANNSIKPPAFGGLVPSSQPAALTKNDNNNKISSATTSTTAFQLSSAPAAVAPTAAPIMFGSPAPSSSLTFNPLNPTTGTPASQSVISFGAKSSAFTSPASTVATAVKSVINFNSVSTQQSTTTFLPTNPNLTTCTPAANATSSPGLFSLGAKSEAKGTSSSTFPFGSPTPAASQNQQKSGGFKFDLGKSVATASATSKSEASKPSMFGAGGSSSINKSGAFAFGPSSATTSAKTSTTNSAPVFGIQNTTATAPSFGAPNKTVTAGMFGAPSTTGSSAVFGAPSTTAGTAVFGAPSTTANAAVFVAPSTTASPGVFGAPSTTAATAVFGATGTTSSTFGAPSTTTAAPVFGSSNTVPNTGIFGSTSSAPAFGTPKTTENPPSFGAFGASSSAPNTGFGAASQNTGTFGFGTPTTTQNTAFGNNTATTTSSFSFGTNSSTKPFAFGATTTTTTSAPAMFGSTSTTTSSNVFGGNTSSGFGNASAAPSTFGGATATTTAQSTFGQQQQQQQQSSAGAFGTASSNFGTGTSGSAFGTNNNNTFGSSTSSNVFGAQQTSSFGSGTSTQGNVFGGNNNNNPGSSTVFGATNATNNNTFGQSSNAAFGSGFSTNNNAQSSGIGNFGSPASQTPGQPSSVFTFGGAAPSSSATPGTSNAFQFAGGSQTPKQSGFNFSANANAGTPNINFGSGAPPAFNATTTPAFGSPAPGQFNTPAPSTGMFNIGSGSTAPKQRPMIKARRRN